MLLCMFWNESNWARTVCDEWNKKCQYLFINVFIWKTKIITFPSLMSTAILKFSEIIHKQFGFLNDFLQCKISWIYWLSCVFFFFSPSTRRFLDMNLYFSCKTFICGCHCVQQVSLSLELLAVATGI